MKLLSSNSKIAKYIILVEKILRNHYRPSNLSNKNNPLNELLYIIISLRTTDPSLQRTYRKFKKTFPKWENVYESRIDKIARVLKNAGLSKQKARNLKLVLKKIKWDWNMLSLRKLRLMSNDSLEEYLLSLPGVGLKSARCIMMYSFARKVFPVDSHCFRVIKRLGWIASRNRYNTITQNYIQDLIPLKIRYRLHVNLVQHGRQVCLPVPYRCKICFINKFCKYYKSSNYRSRKDSKHGKNS